MAEKLYRKLGLNDFEYSEIKKRLNRELNDFEIYLFSAMWSEHCGYKYSKRYINRLPKKQAYCPDENSGGIETGNHVIFFKAESHNHPSAVDPYQGAATGIGGIIRDILTLGARPIALLNSLKFGSLSSERNKYLLDGVVNGISDYGNCIGIPTIGGETSFDDCYSSLPLVNVLAVGIAEKSQIIKSIAKPNGIVMILGSYTGRDGIHGASFASKKLGKNRNKDKLSVQTADPFMKKNVIEAFLEILKLDGVISAQDCGAAGILSSASEMIYKGNCGMELYLDQVHLREDDMQPWEIMLSESQERMVFIIRPDIIDAVVNIAAKYDIEISKIGKTIETKKFKLYWHGKLISILDCDVLNDCVTYELNSKEPNYVKECKIKSLTERKLSKDDIINLLKYYNIASKKYIYSCYDYMVGNRTISKPEKMSANGLWIKEENIFAGFTIDSNYRQVYLNPFEGSRNVVYEAFRNLTASGYIAKGITDCMNFANPQKNETGYQFVKSIDGISHACRELNIPVVSGNVSFYNENETTAIYPTPVIGMMGISKDIKRNTFKENDYVYLIGKEINESSNVGGSLYQKVFYDFLGGEIDVVDFNLELKLSRFILKMYKEDKISACNDVSEGGLFISLFELLHSADLGLEGNLVNDIISQKLLFGEITGQYIICSHSNIGDELKSNKIPYRLLGRSRKNTLDFNGFSFNIKELFEIYDKAFELELNS